MKIKKTFQGSVPENKILNEESSSQTDTYSCDYINNTKELTDFYKNSTITASTIQGFGKIHKLYGKTEETGEGEKSPSNPYEIKCVADNINLFDKDKLQIASAWQATYSLDANKNLTVNSTATSGVAFVKINALSLKTGTYTFSANITGAFQEVRVSKSDGTLIKTISTKTDSFTVTEDTQIYFEFYVWATSTSNTMTIKNIQIEKGTEATAYREYGEGLIKITSTDGTNTSNKVISCKPLCCLKDNENNIIAQDYIDFDRQKIVRQCNRVNLNDLSIYYSTVLGDYFDVQFTTENYKSGFIKCNCLKTNMNAGNAWEAQEESISFGGDGGVCLNIKILKSRLSSPDITGFKNWLASNNIIVVYQLSQAIEEDIDITNSIVQYQNETTISNSNNAEMEIELTNNKAISSINKNIAELQEKDNEIDKTLESNNEVREGTIIPVAGIELWAGAMSSYSLYKVGKVVTLTITISYNGNIPNVLTKVANIKEGFRPKKNIAFTAGFGIPTSNGWSIDITGYVFIDTGGNIHLRNLTGTACKYAFINISYISN